DFVCFSVQCEMTSVEDMELRFRHVLAVALRLAEIEREIVFAPDDEKLWLRLLHPGLPLRIGIDVRPVIVEEVALNLCLPGLVEKTKFVGPQIRIVLFDIRIVAEMARLCRLQ